LGDGESYSPVRIAFTPDAVPSPVAAPAIRAVPPPTIGRSATTGVAAGDPGGERMADRVHEAKPAANVFPSKAERGEADKGADGHTDDAADETEHAALLGGDLFQYATGLGKIHPAFFRSSP